MLGEAGRQRLESRLADYARATGHQFAVVTIPSLEGAPLEDYSIRLAEKWKLGDQKRDDGLLLLVAKAERKVRIEVGYGLEGVIPDALAARVVRHVLTPAFRRSDFLGGIEEALDVLEKAAAGEAVEVGPPEGGGQGPNWARYLPLLLLLGVLVLGRGDGGGGMGGFLTGMLLSSMTRGGRSGGFGGGGGFSGGGGGFGGGGASGDW